MAGDVDADGNEVASNEEEHKKTTSKKVSVDLKHAWRLISWFAKRRRDCGGDAKCCKYVLN